eukprot:7086997-Karenia_brevis.AAC.1
MGAFGTLIPRSWKSRRTGILIDDRATPIDLSGNWMIRRLRMGKFHDVLHDLHNDALDGMKASGVYKYMPFLLQIVRSIMGSIVANY